MKLVTTSINKVLYMIKEFVKFVKNDMLNECI